MLASFNAMIGITEVNGQTLPKSLISAIQFATEGVCDQVHIRLSKPASYAGRKATGSGASIQIPIELLMAETAAGTTTSSRQIPVPIQPTNTAGVTTITYGNDKFGSAEIKIALKGATAYRVIMDEETRHIRIDLAHDGQNLVCNGQAATQLHQRKSALPQEPAVSSEQQLQRGLQELAAKNYEAAISLFASLASTGKTPVSQQAQEYLGVAHEKAGLFSSAQQDYETYLALYPKGEHAARVRQRLADVIAAQMHMNLPSGSVELPPPLADTSTRANLQLANNKDSLKSDLPENITLQSLRNLKETPEDPAKWTWRKYGNAGQFYYRDDSFAAGQSHKTATDMLVSAGSFSIEGENSYFKLTGRSDILNQTGFGKDDIQQTSSSNMYVDVLDKQNHASARIGRQSRSDGGVFGRFDGLLLAWQPQESLSLKFTGGSPVYARDQKPFDENRAFIGASLEYLLPDTPWSSEIYLLEQHVGKLVDRRALGAELRYDNDGLRGFLGADFDLYHSKFNNAFLSANYAPNEQLSIYGSVDYRTLPFLLTSNALSGQQEERLSTLENLLGNAGVLALAADRTANATTLTFGASYKFSDHWQGYLDALIADYSGTPASGGVSAIPDPGADVYVSASMIGSGIFKENDTLGAALRMSESKTSTHVLADTYLRYPVNDNLKLVPRMRISMRDKKHSTQNQFVVMPSLGVQYRVSKNWQLESEIGTRWQFNGGRGAKDETTDIEFTAGYRYQF